MRYFGIHLGHDAGIATFDDFGNLIFYVQAERFSPRIKTHREIFNIFENFKIKLKKNDIVVISNSKEGKTFPLKEYDETLVRIAEDGFAQEKINKNFKIDIVIDHHLAHAFSSWCFRENDDEKLFVTYDGAGATADSDINFKNSLIGVINKFEFYKIDSPYKIPSSIPISSLLGYNSAGKVMGLAGYMSDLPPFEANAESISKLLHKSFNWSILQSRPPIFVEPSQDDLKFIAQFYKFYTNFIWEKICINIEKFGNNREIIIGGGTGLALEINTKIFNKTKKLTFGPPINDSGLALGAAAFAYFHVNKKWPKPIISPSINDLKLPLPTVGPQEPKEIAKIIAEDKVVGLLRQKSECGPRALGFRSIFANAGIKENLKRVSVDLKGREFYRPLAPIVTEQSFEKYFIGPKGEYMQYKCECTKDAQKELPVVVHKDNSARPQVVYKEKDPWLHEILVEYGKLTGHECFVNTSLNGKNKPICNSYEDVLEDFKNKDISITSIAYPENKEFQDIIKFI